jgi:hypothetical protein
MPTSTYRITVSLHENGTSIPMTVLCASVEAERYSHACIKAWAEVNAACEKSKAETGKQTTVGDLHVARNPRIIMPT